MRETDNVEFKVNELLMQKFYIAATQVLSDFPLATLNAQIKYFQPYDIRGLVVQLHTYLLGKEHVVGMEEVPINWFQMFKKEVFPKWLVRKFPVRTRQIKYTINKICPHINEKWPDNKMPHINWMSKVSPTTLEEEGR